MTIFNMLDSRFGTACLEGEGDPAPAPAAAPAPAVESAPAAAPAPALFSWDNAGLTADNRTFIGTKGFEGADTLVESYRNLEKLAGAPADQLIKLPATDDPAAWRPIYERLGAGKEAGDYKLPVPEGQDGEFAKVAAGWFHEAGISVKAATALVEKWNEHMAGAADGNVKQRAQQDTAEMAALDTEWGPNKQANTVLVDKAAEAFGMSQEQLLALRQAMGPAAAMKFMHTIGSKMGVEGEFIGDSGERRGFGGITPEQAKADIQARREDKTWVQKYSSGDKDARAEMDRLHRIAYPEG